MGILQGERMTKDNLKEDLKRYKGFIFAKNYGKQLQIFRLLKSKSEEGKLKYLEVTVEEKETHSMEDIKERKTISNRDMFNFIERKMNE